MQSLDHVKRQMLADAVAHNVAVVAGVRPRPRPPRTRLHVFASKGFAFAAAGALGLALAAFAESGADSPPARVAAPRLEHPDLRVSLRPESAPAPLARTTLLRRPLDPAVFPLAVRTVVIDPGHGGENHGTRAPSGLVEKDVVLDIAQRVERLLAARGYAVVLTRTRDDAQSLRARTEHANRARGDIFVSIHLNWISTRRTRGVETYYLGQTDDPLLERLAAVENRESGYRLTDLRSILDELYADARQSESERLATAVQRALLDALRQVNPGLENRGVKRAPFVVLTTTEMPAILAEVSCLSNEEEAALLREDAYRERIAAALADGVDGYANTRARVSAKGTDDEF